MKLSTATAFLAILYLAMVPWASAAGDAIDASDPTKIYTYAGGGLKYTDYTNDEEMWELRVIGNLGLSASDMVLFELGYGWHSGDSVSGRDSGLTNGRFRWFHLFEMKYDLEKGFRGWGTQLDVQLAGQLKGTDGQNQIIVGLMPTFALGASWNLYLQLNLVNSWDKDFKYWNGAGSNVAPQLVFSPEDWWPGAQVQFIPQYTYFVTGEFESDGSGVFEVNVGGELTPTVMWDITGQKNFDLYLRSLRRGASDELESDWDVFFNVTAYF